MSAAEIPVAKPTLLDRAIGWLSPKAGAERLAWRTVVNTYRGGVPNRMSETWPTATGNRFGNAAERQEVIGTRNRAYTAFENNPVARTVVETECDNVIGDGLNYQPTSKDKKWNREAISRYYKWLRYCSVRGPDAHPGFKVQRFLWEQSRVAGDIGWILVKRDFLDPKTGKLRLSSKIQIVPAENIATPDALQGTASVYDGITFDAEGRPETFHVLNVNDLTGQRDFFSVPARDFVWLPHMTKPNQARPPSCYVTIFDALSNLQRYVDGVALAAWMATVFGIIFKQNNAARQVGALPYLTNSQGEQQRAITFENGTMKFIGTDEEVAQVQAHQPMQQTPEFIRTMLRQIGMPFNMPLEIIAKDMSTATFASARIGLLPFYRTCRTKAAEFGIRWSRTIEWWLSRERLRGPDDPERWENEFPPDFLEHELLVNAWDYTDPVSEAQSDQLQIDMGTKSPQMVIAERGRDLDQILSEREEWLKKTKELPQTHSTLTRDPPTEPEPADPAAPKPLQADMVRALMGDKTTREIIYNVADVPALLADAGVKLDAAIDSADGEGLPVLPATGDDEHD